MLPSWSSASSSSVTIAQSIKNYPETPSPVYTCRPPIRHSFHFISFVQLFCRGCWTMSSAWGKKSFPILNTSIWHCVASPPPPAWDSRPDQWHQAWIPAALPSGKAACRAAAGVEGGAEMPPWPQRIVAEGDPLTSEGRNTTGYWWPFRERERGISIGEQHQGSAQLLRRGNAAHAQVWNVDRLLQIR